MKNNPASDSGASDPRLSIGVAFCSIGALLALLSVGIFPGATALAQKATKAQEMRSEPDVVPLIGPVSQDQDLRTLPYFPGEQAPEAYDLRRHSKAQSQGIDDPVVAVRQIAQIALSAPLATFAGINSVQSACNCLPPDTHGDVGPNHYVQSVNLSIQIFDKAGAALTGVTTYNSFFSALGPTTPCGNNQNRGDGSVIYDQMADRWVISDFAFAAFPGTSFYQCIGVSKTSDPVAGGWWLYALQIDPANPTFLGDVPKLGLWPDAYYLTVNLYDNNLTFRGVRVFALDRSRMMNGTGAPTPTAVAFTISPATLGDTYSLVPATFRGAAPPAGTPEYFMAIDSPATAGAVQTQIKTWLFDVDFVTPANSTFGVGATHAANGTTTVNGFVAAFTTTTNLIPQPGTTAKLDTQGDHLMTPLVYQNRGGTESLWVSHTVNNNQGGTGPTGIRWYQFNVTGNTIPASPVQQQTFTNNADGLWRWNPSIAVNGKGDMAIGYSVSSSTSEPSIRYAGRLAVDPLNTLTQGEALLIAGGGHQTSSTGRWGDYSATSVDPSDNLTFWHTNEYYAATSTAAWSTRIGSFKFSLVTLTVTTVDDHDDGLCNAVDCTLREAINAVNAQPQTGRILFRPGLTGTVQLGSALPSFTTNTIVQGPGANLLTVRRNTAAEYRIFTIENRAVTLEGLTISNGNLPASGNTGGGIFNNGGILTLTKCAVTGNHGYAGGGLYNANGGNAAVIGCTFSGNTAFEGGAIDNAAISGNATLVATNSTFSGNTASNNAGGVGNGAFGGPTASLTLTNCTFSGNSAPTGGGVNNGVAFGGSATTIVRNSIFKTGPSGANLANSGGTITSQGSNRSNDSGGGFLVGSGDLNNTDPMIGALQDNGGPTFTHALLAGSNAINNGNNTFAPTSDQRGFVRVGTSDIGAFESGAVPLRITNIARSGNDILITFDAVAGKGFALEGKAALSAESDWESVAGTPNLTAVSGSATFTHSGGATLGHFFYRVRLLP